MSIGRGAVMLELRKPRVEDEASLRAADREFAEEGNDFNFASGLAGAVSFAEYLDRLERWSRALDLPEGYVPWTQLIGVVGSEVVGCLSLRHRLTDALRTVGGHIGYGVVRSQRRKGHGTEMLRQALPFCAALGIERALVTCDEDNVASVKVIERNGGVMENITDDPVLAVRKRRYWIDVQAQLL
ncbi:MAG: GNAT family N-acetyltransferase [Chitinivibrionales bacterium]|nr:GNAT family N-acetyltransferase [Chitinivibrionales bacterium]